MEGAAKGICAPFLEGRLFLLPTTTSFPSLGNCHSHSHRGAVPLLAEDPAPSQDQDSSGFLTGCGLHAGTSYFISFAKGGQDRPFPIMEVVPDLRLHDEPGAGRWHCLHRLMWRVGGLVVGLPLSKFCARCRVSNHPHTRSFPAGGPGHQHPAALRPHTAGRHAPVGLPGAAQRGAVAHGRAAEAAQVTAEAGRHGLHRNHQHHDHHHCGAGPEVGLRAIKELLSPSRWCLPA